MASARSRLGAARRSLIKRKKKTDVFSGILGTAGTVAAFAGTQAKKAKTAWGEYEAGYKALGGDPTDILKRGGFFKQLGQTLVPGGDKGFFQGPEGEVTIGDKIYDRSKIRKAGAFLGSEAATALFAGEGGEDIQKKYLQRTAPGKGIEGPFQETEAGGYGVDPDPRGMSLYRRLKLQGGFKGYGGGKGYGEDAGSLYQGPRDERYTPLTLPFQGPPEAPSQISTLPEVIVSPPAESWQNKMGIPKSETITERTARERLAQQKGYRGQWNISDEDYERIVRESY